MSPGCRCHMALQLFPPQPPASPFGSEIKLQLAMMTTGRGLSRIRRVWPFIPSPVGWRIAGGVFVGNLSLRLVLPGSNWRMAHELAAAGHGFLWPNLTFASDSQSVQVVGHPRILCLRSLFGSSPISPNPFRLMFLSVRLTICSDLYSRGFAHLDRKTLASSLFGTKSVRASRSGTRDSSSFRSSTRLRSTRGTSRSAGSHDFALNRAGEQAAEEIAPACAGPDPAGALNAIEKIASLPGIQGTQDPADILRKELRPSLASPFMPWERGPRCAGCSPALWMEWSAAQRRISRFFTRHQGSRSETLTERYRCSSRWTRHPGIGKRDAAAFSKAQPCRASL